MTKIKIDDDVSMLTDKQLKINILNFLDEYRDILINKMKDPEVYNDDRINSDVYYMKRTFTMIKKGVKDAII
jgi:hypothetical protein